MQFYILSIMNVCVTKEMIISGAKMEINAHRSTQGNTNVITIRTNSEDIPRNSEVSVFSRSDQRSSMDGGLEEGENGNTSK